MEGGGTSNITKGINDNNTHTHNIGIIIYNNDNNTEKEKFLYKITYIT
mgnify:CR=1 FL=1